MVAGPGARPVRSGVRAVVDVTVLVVALAVALVPLVPVYGVRAAVPALVGGLVLGTAAGVVGAVRRWSAVVVVAVVVLAYFVAGGALAAPSTTVAGVVPTLRTVTTLAVGATASWKQVLTLQPPVGTSGALLVVPFLLALVGAATVSSTTLRVRAPGRAALAAAVPGLALAGSALLGTRQTIQPVATGLGLALVLVVWAAWRVGQVRPRRVVALVVLGGVVLGGGVLAGPVVTAGTPRFVLRDELVPPFDPRAYPSPLSAFRKIVKAKDDPLFTVSGLPAGARVRLATMDEFDGVVWNVAGDGSAQGSGEFRRVGETIETTVRGTAAQVEIEVQELAGVWLPTVGQATSVRFDDPSVTADLRYNDATGGAVLTRGISEGLRYTLDVVVPPVPDDATVGEAPPAPVVVPDVTGVPDVIGATAADVARDAGTPVQIARSLQKALSEGGFFSHGITEAGDHPSFSGHGADRLTTLLGSDLMVGDGEQYASAMALMARQMGLPSRVVLGFVPSEEERAADSTTVTGDDVEAWVEIAFAGYGWVPFDPTPPRSQTPQEDSQTKPSDPEPQVVQPPPAPPEPVTPPEDDTEQPRAQDPDSEADAAPLWLAVARVAGIVSVPLVVLLGPLLVVVLVKARRRRRRRSRPDAVDRVAGGWDEVLDAARDLRHDPSPLATRREVAAELTGALVARSDDAAVRFGSRGGAVVSRLAEDADEAVFGPGTPTLAEAAAYWRRVEQAIADMRGTVPWRGRLRARVSLASLRRAGRTRRRPARGSVRRSASGPAPGGPGPRPTPGRAPRSGPALRLRRPAGSPAADTARTADQEGNDR
jgi:transglutaminase-like putative cysteine protease